MTTYGHTLAIADGFQLLVGTYIQQSGGTITFTGNGELNIGQTISVTGGTFTATSGLINFGGTGTREWSGVTTFHDLSISGGGQLHLPSSTISGNLDLLSGYIIMDSEPLTVGTVTGGNGTSFVYGAVAHAFGSVPFTFPVGNVGFAPVT